jgi:hypothetical protein
MRSLRFTIAKLMAAVVVAALLLAVFRFGSFFGLVALVPLGITSLVARLGSSRAVRWLAFSLGATGTLVLPFLAAIWANNEEWGYYVARPVVDWRIVEVRQVETLTRVDTRSDRSGNSIFSGVPVEEVDRFIQDGPEGDYYVLEGRALRDLKSRRALPARSPVMPAGRLRGLYKLLNETGLLENGTPGYEYAKELSGIAVEALGRDGRQLVFVGARGGPVSNDHYPFYEFLFTTDSPGGQLKLLSSQRFYFDVAGDEGLEWPVALTFFAIASLIPTLLIQGLILWRGHRRSRRSDKKARQEQLVIKADPSELRP